MKEILIFAGTTEGRKLSEYLAAAEIKHHICIATEYGQLVLETNPFVFIHQGRKNQEEIEIFLKNGNFTVVIDATHPFAKNITRNIKAAIKERKQKGQNIFYLRLKREQKDRNLQITSNITYFETNEACEKALEDTKGNILLTTGSQELSKYCISDNIKSRLYVRILPSIESISHCMEQGICGKQVIAMQGPFSVEMNEAILCQYNISYLVTKESGISGGYLEKLEAARRVGIPVLVIGCPKESEGFSFFEICNKIEKICYKKISIKNQMEITLAGIGMGDKNCLTKEVKSAIEEADILLGAERMLRNYHGKWETHPFYQAEQIIPYLKQIQEENRELEQKKIVILFSGDSGFYSGCQSLYTALKKEMKEKRLYAKLHILSGISCVSYLASCLGESYQDAAIYSLHGKKQSHLIHKIKNNHKIFLLTSGVKDINYLGKLLIEADMSECEIVIGQELSYQEQKIKKYTPEECCKLKEEGLYTCFIKNPNVAYRKLTHGMADSQFIRTQIPMTKEEVREISICKLQLREKSVVYDIGSGTGSIAVEIAGLSDEIQVYAIERKKEAVSLIEKNKEKFGLQNITIIEKEAPKGLLHLPVADYAFIGGSGGKLKEMVKTLKEINPKMRVVIPAVSMETICEIKELLSLYSITEEEIVQLQVSRAERKGNYHLMQSENPIWICAFNFK